MGSSKVYWKSTYYWQEKVWYKIMGSCYRLESFNCLCIQGMLY
jgi:hypothetical protein